MGRKLAKILALSMCMLLLCSSVCFAVSVVSPVANSIMYTDSVLVSVKLTEKATVNVTVYEEKDVTGVTVLNPAGELVSVDVSKLKEEDLAILSTYRTAAENAEVPVLSDGSKAKKYTDSVFCETVKYTNSGEIGFYTKQLTDVHPGLYRIQVDTLDDKGLITASTSSLIAVRQKEDEQKTNIFQNQNTSAFQFIQNLLKKVFK